MHTRTLAQACHSSHGLKASTVSKSAVPEKKAGVCKAFKMASSGELAREIRYANSICPWKVGRSRLLIGSDLL